jgi:rhodanese-related sulfurtransferase
MKTNRLRALILALLFATLMVAGCTTAKTAKTAEAKVDTSWKFHDVVDVKFIQQHVKMPKAKDVMIIDSRPKKAKFDKGYIPTAVSIPDSKFAKMTDKLPKDKNTLLVFYCQGPTWKLSHKSAWKAEKMGYTNVKVFAAGFPAWKKTGDYYAVEAPFVKTVLDKIKPAVIVDSRPTKPKYIQGHIPGAISIPDKKFDKLKGILPVDKNIPLIFYCGGYTWKLSHLSARKAVKDGYKDVIVFAAGYPAWKKFAGTTSKSAVDVKAGGEEGSIDIKTFKKILAENPDTIQLIDVRDKDEYVAGHFKTAINIPTDDLEKNAKKLSGDKPIVFVCNSGAKSGEAFYMMMDLRADLKKVFYLDAETKYKKDGSFTITKPQ